MQKSSKKFALALSIVAIVSFVKNAEGVRKLHLF